MADVANLGPNAQSIPVPNNDWPTDMLYIHLSGKIEDLKGHIGDLRTADLLALQAAFVAAEKAVQTAFIAQEKAIIAALEADKRTSEIVERTNDELRELQTKYTTELQALQSRYTENHLAQLADASKRSIEERSHFVSNDAYFAAHAPLVQDIESLKLSRERDRGKQAAQVAIVGVIFAIVSLAMRFL